jgi:CheY-like chemotaxis protein
MPKDVLVVDDEEDIREFLKTLLEDRGYSVRVAKDGLEAMELMHAAKPDLVLLDLMMPQETGTGLYRKMHGKKELRQIPVVVISGVAGRNVAVSRSVPVFDKPIDEARLLTTIEELTGSTDG